MLKFTSAKNQAEPDPKGQNQKAYIKVKERETFEHPRSSAATKYLLEEEADPASLEMHPERQALLGRSEVLIESEPKENTEHRSQVPAKRPHKQKPFDKEAQQAQQRKEEAAARREAIEESNRQRQKKIEERERFRKAMAKARTGGKNGQRKLGRESKVLLEKVKRVVSS